MLNIQSLRQLQPSTVFLGAHPPIIQSILDFDYLSQKEKPSISAIISENTKQHRYFWDDQEIFIPGYSHVNQFPNALTNQINMFVSVFSGRRTLPAVQLTLQHLPNLQLGSIFAENVPEQHTLQIYQLSQKTRISIIGPASIGLVIPGFLKLGAIGGITPNQIISSNLNSKLNTHNSQLNFAILSASGGMTNELINICSQNHLPISFSLSFGGDRFPITTPDRAFLAAQQDPQTTHIIYYGELGGQDEYQTIQLIKAGKITKPIIAYIAGTVSEMFVTPLQFGHAKAIAKKQSETALAKRAALRNAGATTPDTFSEFTDIIKNMNKNNKTSSNSDHSDVISRLGSRHKALFSTTISGETNGQITLLNQPLIKFAQNHSLTHIILSLWLGQNVKSKQFIQTTELIFKLLADHGPYVSGAVNTIISARAGKDLVSSLASGLLTIGPRFGGAVNSAAQNWFTAVQNKTTASDFVENHAKIGKRIPGIGHKKYRLDDPDPRVAALIKQTKNLKLKTYLQFAQSVETITTNKKANLILNVDGTVAAVMLDLLSEKEKLTDKQILDLIGTEFFNALFIFSRSIGFIAHYLDQRRLNEGLFKLPASEIAYIKGN